MSNPDETLTPAGEEATRPSPPEPLRDTALPASSSAAETLVGMSASAGGQEPAAPLTPGDQAIHNQDTVVSPRLRQMATTPVQPLRPPAGMPPRTAIRNQPAARAPAESSTRLYMLVGVVAVLVLLALILVAVILARSGPSLLAGLNPAKTPTATRRSLATAVFPPTDTPAPTAVPTAPPSTATPRPAPTALGKDVLAKATPPEGLKLKVRQSASVTGELLGELEVNAEVAIVDGPTDASGITWWKVDNGKGLVGWSAEGVGGVKYLIPVGWAK